MQRMREKGETSSGKEVRWREVGMRRHFELMAKNSKIYLIILSCEWREDQLGVTALRIAFLIGYLKR